MFRHDADIALLSLFIIMIGMFAIAGMSGFYLLQLVLLAGIGIFIIDNQDLFYRVFIDRDDL